MEIFLLIVWILNGIITAVIAQFKNHNGPLWFILGLFFPTIALIIIIFFKETITPENAKPNPNSHVKCPDCAEIIRREAKICKHCGCKLVPQPINDSFDLKQKNKTRIDPEIIINNKQPISEEFINREAPDLKKYNFKNGLINEYNYINKSDWVYVIFNDGSVEVANQYRGINRYSSIEDAKKAIDWWV
jgi:hypothetical protein